MRRQSGSEYIVYDDGLSPSKTALEASVRSIRAIIEFAYDEMGPGRMNIRVPKTHDSGVGSTVWRDPELEKGGVAARKALDATVAQSCHYLRNKRPQFDAITGGHVLDFKGRVTMPSVKNFQVQSDVCCLLLSLLAGGLATHALTHVATIACLIGPRRRHGAPVRSHFVSTTWTARAVQVPQEHIRAGRQGTSVAVALAVLLVVSPLTHSLSSAQHPLSPLQAFAICLSTLDSKFADQKLYDHMTSLVKRK